MRTSVRVNEMTSGKLTEIIKTFANTHVLEIAYSLSF
jgi:hypothetical protein